MVLETILVAFAMFSAIPLPRVDWNGRNMRYALCAFPLVGAVCGGLWWGWAWMCGWLGAPELLRGAGFCLIPALVTGGIHLDGCADTWDALASCAPPEKKQEKRQELQKEINELNMQLRQHEMEQKVKEREEKRQAEENPLGLPENQDMARKDSRPGVELGISAAGMEALISADGARKAADTQGSVAQRMEGKAGVLEVEIKMDAARNGDTSSKQEQLADVTNKAQAAQSAQMSSLQKAGEELEKAADAGEGMEGVQKKDEDKVSSKDDAANDNGEESRNGKESG